MNSDSSFMQPLCAGKAVRQAGNVCREWEEFVRRRDEKTQLSGRRKTSIRKITTTHRLLVVVNGDHRLLLVVVLLNQRKVAEEREVAMEIS